MVIYIFYKAQIILIQVLKGFLFLRSRFHSNKGKKQVSTYNMI